MSSSQVKSRGLTTALCGECGRLSPGLRKTATPATRPSLTWEAMRGEASRPTDEHAHEDVGMASGVGFVSVAGRWLRFGGGALASFRWRGVGFVSVAGVGFVSVAGRWLRFGEGHWLRFGRALSGLRVASAGGRHCQALACATNAKKGRSLRVSGAGMALFSGASGRCYRSSVNSTGLSRRVSLMNVAYRQVAGRAGLGISRVSQRPRWRLQDTGNKSGGGFQAS